MLGRRKSNEGFEWHKYIRTSVRARREERRERVLQARRAAAQQAGAAGVALAQGSRAAGSALAQGSRAAGVATWGAVLTGLSTTWLVTQAVWALIGTAAAIAWQKLRVAAQPLVAALARPNIGGPIALAGAIALGSGIGRYRSAGLDGEAVITLGIGVALLIAACPLVSSLTGLRMPSLTGLGISPRVGFGAVAIAAVATGVVWFASGGRIGFADLAGQLPLVGGDKPLQGRAHALAGDLVRVGSTTVRLTGIEAPERQQVCGTGNRRQQCGAAARAALGRLVDGRSLRCTLSGSDAAGRPLGSCTRGRLDINGELVRHGHVFAEVGVFASYAGLEREARTAKAGIWASGEIERPAKFRAKIWDEAKRRAPEGCPIKGRVTGGARVYVLPWSPDYDRGRIQKARGERWFCSEEEAVAAGWKPAVRG